MQSQSSAYAPQDALPPSLRAATAGRPAVPDSSAQLINLAMAAYWQAAAAQT
jgi:hypothetical protein